MPSIPLTSGAYSAEGYIANAQRSINLFAEKNPPETKPSQPVTHYPRPGLRLASAPPAAAPARCLFGATNGDLYAVLGQNVYWIDVNLTWTLLGQLVTNAATPVSMADNGTTVLVVDGSTSGNQIDLTSSLRAMTIIGDPNFLGSTRVDFLDYFLILNNPGTKEWYCSLSQQAIFNGLFVGIKTAWADNVLCVVAIEREAWLFGPKKSEVWFNAGTVPFPFQALPGNIIEQGCAAVYSPAKIDTNVYWLSQSPEGNRMVMRGNSQNVAQRISTHAIENEFRTYARVDDAIGATYEMNGHQFYKLHFPTADKTWGYDEATGQWHEDNWIDSNGILHRARNTFCAFAYGKNFALDWANGNLYQMDANYAFDDATSTTNAPVVWIRSFPHSLDEMKRISYSAFIADVETGTSLNTGELNEFVSPWSSGLSSGFGPLTQIAAATINFRISRDGGETFENNRPMAGLSSGRYRRLLRWRACGIARDAVFELSSTAQMCGALNGAYIDPIMASS